MDMNGCITHIIGTNAAKNVTNPFCPATDVNIPTNVVSPSTRVGKDAINPPLPSLPTIISDSLSRMVFPFVPAVTLLTTASNASIKPLTKLVFKRILLAIPDIKVDATAVTAVDLFHASTKFPADTPILLS